MLALPNPGDWCTWAYAEQVLGVARRTVIRMVNDGVLTRHRSQGGAPMLWLPEVREVAEARRRTGRRPRA